ncbi:MAG: DUF1847 domain-containing protein [Synergistaceae bacterium]|nr:DUF1847 domain-containing protein [Synergistaceae bacterium]
MKCHLCDTKGCSTGDPCSDFGSLELYSEEDLKLLTTASDVEALYYCTLNRLEEIMEFARRMKFTRLGIAFCVGFRDEAAMLGQILSEEFEIFSACCKVSSMKKDDVNATRRPWVGEVSCNPAEQARQLDESGSQLNIVLGLCVGHDSLFYRHSKAPVTTFVVKDRVLGHNPVAVLYSQYLRKNLKRRPEERVK